MKRIGRGVTVDDETLAFDVIKEVGCGGTFLVEDHTVEHFREEFYMPTISDRLTYEQWMNKGGERIEKRANRRWKEILANYGESTLDSDIDRDLRKYMETH